jgi:hypothetical protein
LTPWMGRSYAETGKAITHQGPEDTHHEVNALMALLDDGDIVRLPVRIFDPENFALD